MSEVRNNSGQTGSGSLRRAEKLMDKPIIRRAGLLLLRFVLGIVLSQATVFYEYAPFGVGYVAAAGLGTPGFSGLLGTLCGYMFLWDLSNGLKYIAISLLVFAAGFVFQGTRFSRRTSFMPMTVLISSAFVGIVFLAADSFALAKSLLFVTELILAGGSAYFFQIALRWKGWPEPLSHNPSPGLQRLVSLLILFSCIFLALSPIKVFGALSPARFFAMLLTMLMAYRSGVGAGSTVGLAIGAALDLASGTPLNAMTLGLTGLIGGAFQDAGKPIFTGAGVLVAAATTLWAGDTDLRLFIIVEAILAAIIFLLLPETALPLLSATPSRRTMEDLSQTRLRDHLKYRLNSCATAFHALHESLNGLFGPLSRTDNEEDIAVVFDRTAERVCRRCALVSICWDRDSTSTIQALGTAAGAMMAHGTLDPTDFPAHFSSRCLNYNRFVSVSNEELSALMYRRQYNSRLRQSRLLICRQYAEMSRVLDGLATDAAQTLSFNWEAEEKLGRWLKTVNVIGRVSVTEDDDRRVRVDIQGRDLSELTDQRKRTVRDLSTLLGTRLNQPEQERDASGERLVFTEANPLTAKLGVASHNKLGESVSGDSGTWFRTVDGRLVVMLSDGMGSGPEASTESGLALRLLEQFLRAGIQPETALATLNSALLLKGEEQPGFVTVDLLMINLLTGETAFYKFGAAPSYIKRGRKVSRIIGVTLPAGLSPGGSTAPMMDVTRMRLGHGETVLLVSDGVSDAQNDKWMEKTVSQWNTDEPKDLARRVLESALHEKGRGDDMTVLALRVEKRSAAARAIKASAG